MRAGVRAAALIEGGTASCGWLSGCTGSCENTKGPLRDVRRALLEADVSLPVVRRFIKKVEEKAAGLEVGPGGGRGCVYG